MRKWIIMAGLSTALAACVTINVYFPEAEAEKAADQFIEEVIAPSGGEAPASPQAPQASMRTPSKQLATVGGSFALLDFFISSAHAQTANIKIETPAIVSIQKRMRDRFVSKLEKWYSNGAIGFTQDGMVEVRDQTAVPLAERTALKSLVAEDNRDRDAVYREIAVANDHPEWEPQIRQAFADEWVDNARPGWYYKDSAGAWKKK